MRITPSSEAEATLFKKKIKEMAEDEGLRVRFKDEVRRKLDDDGEFIARDNCAFVVYQGWER